MSLTYSIEYSLNKLKELIDDLTPHNFKSSYIFNEIHQRFLTIHSSFLSLCKNMNESKRQELIDTLKKLIGDIGENLTDKKTEKFYNAFWAILSLDYEDDRSIEKLNEISNDLVVPGNSFDNILSVENPSTIYSAIKVLNKIKKDNKDCNYKFCPYIKNLIIHHFDIKIKSDLNKEEYDERNSQERQDWICWKKNNLNEKTPLNAIKAKFVDKNNSKRFIEVLKEPKLHLDFLEYLSIFLMKYKNISSFFDLKSDALKYLLIFRKVCKIYYNISPEDNDKILTIIRNLEDKKISFCILFGYYFDTKQNFPKDIIETDAEYKQYIINHINYISVVFAPLFLNIQYLSLKTLSKSSRIRNKRMKVGGYDNDFIELAYLIVKSPIQFSNFMNKRESKRPELRLHCSKKNPWKIEEALSYLNSILSLFNNNNISVINNITIPDSNSIDNSISIEIYCDVIRQISTIQKHLINQFTGINYTFLSNYFFDKCFPSDDPKKDYFSFQAIKNIIESTSFSRQCS